MKFLKKLDGNFLVSRAGVVFFLIAREDYVELPKCSSFENSATSLPRISQNCILKFFSSVSLFPA